MLPVFRILKFSLFNCLFFNTILLQAYALSDIKQSFSGNMVATSNYVDRGITNTSNLPALQGQLTWTFLEPGLYAQLWGSNVKFQDIKGKMAPLEIDGIIGVKGKLKINFTWDLSLVRYIYPQTYDLDYNEVIASGQYYFLTGWIGYSSDVYALGVPGVYYNAGINYDLPERWVFNLKNMNLVAQMGYYHLPDSFGLRSYEDYSIQLGKTMKQYFFSVRWTSTTGKPIPIPSWYDSKLIAAVTVNF